MMAWNESTVRLCESENNFSNCNLWKSLANIILLMRAGDHPKGGPISLHFAISSSTKEGRSLGSVVRLEHFFMQSTWRLGKALPLDFHSRTYQKKKISIHAIATSSQKLGFQGIGMGFLRSWDFHRTHNQQTLNYRSLQSRAFLEFLTDQEMVKKHIIYIH